MSKKTDAGNATYLNIMASDPAFASLYWDEYALAPYFGEDVPQFAYRAHEGLTDAHLYRIMHHMSDEKDFEANISTLTGFIIARARQNPRNMVREKLASLVWDQKPRLDTLLVQCGGASDTAYTRAVTARTLISAVARAYEPGCKVDTICILEGVQGVRKSTFWETIGAVAGNQHVLNRFVSPRDRDSGLLIARHWFVIIDEFEALTSKNLGEMKAFITYPKDTFRAPYARFGESHPRRCIFVGTINDSGEKYLKDSTGNRRYWPVQVNQLIDTDYIMANRDQVWAEAVVRYQDGERWWIDEADGALLEEAREEQEARRELDPWEESVSFWVGQQTKPFTLNEAANALAIQVQNRDAISHQRLGRLLTSMGLKSSRRMNSAGKKVTMYDPSGYVDQSGLTAETAPNVVKAAIKIDGLPN